MEETLEEKKEEKPTLFLKRVNDLEKKVETKLNLDISVLKTRR